MFEVYETLNENWIFSLVIIIAVILSLLCLEPIANLFSKKRTFKEGAYSLVNKYRIKKPLVVLACLIGAFVITFSNSVIVWTLSGKTDLRLAPEGVHFYSVIINREENSSRYTLPAKIKKIDNTYYIEEVYFNNGGVLYFNSYEYNDFDKLVTNADQNGEFWQILITNLKTSPPNNMVDYYEFNFWGIFFDIIASAVLLMEAFVLLLTKNPKYSEKNIKLQAEIDRLLEEKASAKRAFNRTLNDYELTPQQEIELADFYVRCAERIESKIKELEKDLIR